MKLFETITMKSKRKYYPEKLLEFQDDAKKTWRIMKEVTGKSKLIHSTLLRKIVINPFKTEADKLKDAFFSPQNK